MNTVFSYIKNFIDKYFSIPTFYISDLIEIIVLAILVYYVILWFRKSRAWFLLRGIVVLVLFMLVASVFHLNTLLWIINNTLNVGIIAIVIIFQPELRRALEELGKKNVLFHVLKLGSGNTEERFTDKSVEEITRATLEMSKAKTGALMVIKQEHDLSRYIETGIGLEAKISSQLLINIFEKNTPLHDGAVVLDGDEIVAATCYLPLSDSNSLSKDLGTRHRAGLGVSEATDCVVIIVSEETGSISIAKEGRLIRYADAAILKNELIKAQAKVPEKEEAKEQTKTKKRFWKGRGHHEESDDQNKDIVDK